MKRLATMMVALVLASLAAVSSVTPAAAAFNSPGYEFRPNSFGGVVDLSCDGTHTFEMILYFNLNYDNYAKLKLCSVEDDLCDVQIADVAIPNGCGGEFSGTTWHNVISSYKILSHPTAIGNGGDWCIVLYDARYYNTQNAWPFGWGKMVRKLGSDYYPNLNYIGKNDSISSVKRTTSCD